MEYHVKSDSISEVIIQTKIILTPRTQSNELHRIESNIRNGTHACLFNFLRA